MSEQFHEPSDDFGFLSSRDLVIEALRRTGADTYRLAYDGTFRNHQPIEKTLTLQELAASPRPIQYADEVMAQDMARDTFLSGASDGELETAWQAIIHRHAL